jgi:hypothetical protein
MSHTAIRFGIAASAALVIAPPLLARAQTEQGGFSAGIGLAYASARATGIVYGTGYPGPNPHPSVALGTNAAEGVFGYLGSRVHKRMRLAGELSVLWSRASAAPVTSDLRVTLDYYLPRPGTWHAPSHLFLTLGPGLSSYQAHTTTNFCIDAILTCYTVISGARGLGWSVMFGLGYDVLLGRQVGLTPVLRYVYDDLGTLSPQATNWTQTLVEFGLELRYH